jgi:hypothetical protein
VLNILYINSPKYDVITALHIEGLIKIDNIDIYYTSLGNYAPENKVLEEDEAEKFANQKADMVILGSRPHVNEKLFERIIRKDIVKVIIEGGDESFINYSIFKFKNIDFLFKREIYKNDNHFSSLNNAIFPQNFGLWYKIRTHRLLKYPYFHSMSNVAKWKRFLFIRVFFKNLILTVFCNKKIKSFNLGVEDRFIERFNESPKYTLTAMMRIHSSERKELLDILKSFKIQNSYYNSPIATEKNILWMIDKGACHPNYRKVCGIGMAQNKEYFNKISNSLACVSAPGGGFDTLRFWEILARGSLLITKRIDIEIDNCPVEGKHYLAFDTQEELSNIIKFILERPTEVDKIRRAGYLFALKYHNSKSRAEYFLNTVKGGVS